MVYQICNINTGMSSDKNTIPVILNKNDSIKFFVNVEFAKIKIQ